MKTTDTSTASTKQTESLRTRILSATTEKQVTDLLTEGTTFKHASAVSQRRWKRAARVRLADIKGTKIEPEAIPVPVEENETEFVSDKKKNRGKKKVKPIEA
jgi:hypothetical protein